MDVAGFGAIADAVSNIIDKVFPDAESRDKAKLEMLNLQQTGELKKIEIQMSAILAEANSADPWTSRARPSFMYVFYILVLAAIPMGFLHAFKPDIAFNVAAGFSNWLEAMPEEMWWLFGAGYLGYTGARSFEKKKILK